MNLNDTPLATAWHVIRVHGDKPLQERVRQLEERALTKLRGSQRAGHLLGYLN